jgi:hypothetical protein
LLVSFKERSPIAVDMGPALIAVGWINDAPSLPHRRCRHFRRRRGRRRQGRGRHHFAAAHLDVLERGVAERHRAFGNIMKFIMRAMSSNFRNMFSTAGATLILPFLPMLPVRILLNNLLYAVSAMPIPYVKSGGRGRSRTYRRRLRALQRV